MRIVIDMQGMQTDSRNRGIGRYTRSLVKAIINDPTKHEVILFINGLFPETIPPIIEEYSALLQPQQFKIWEALGPISYVNEKNNWRRKAAKYIWQDCIQQLNPDVILITSLFEGLGDDHVVNVNALKDSEIITSIIFYDLIPLINPKEYLVNIKIKEWYEEQLNELKSGNLLLAISKHSRDECVANLQGFRGEVINISSAADEIFQVNKITEREEILIRERYGLHKEYLMYSGPTDPRKNHVRLIQAYGQLPCSIKKNHQLVIVGHIPDKIKKELLVEADRVGLSKNDFKIVGRVDDDDLIYFYSLCKGYIFPSWHEGFGLPALEAIKCGAPVICSNTTSLPEVVGVKDALFDPLDVKSISSKIALLLTDQVYRNELIKKQHDHVKKFNWANSAHFAIHSMEKLFDQRKKSHAIQQGNDQKKGYEKLVLELYPYRHEISQSELLRLAVILANNEKIASNS